MANPASSGRSARSEGLLGLLGTELKNMAYRRTISLSKYAVISTNTSHFCFLFVVVIFVVVVFTELQFIYNLTLGKTGLEVLVAKHPIFYLASLFWYIPLIFFIYVLIKATAN